MADRQEEIRAQLMATFRVQAGEHLDAMRGELASLERTEGPARAHETLEALFRETHTLKGAAHTVGLAEIEARCRALEALLSRLTREPTSPGRDDLGRLGRAVAELSELLARVGEQPDHPGLPAGPGARAGEVSPPAGPAAAMAESVRVAAAGLEALLARGEDLLETKLTARERIHHAAAALEAVGRCRSLLALPAAGPARFPDMGPALRAAEGQLRRLLDGLVSHAETLAGSVDGLMEELRALRITPVRATLLLLESTARELAREQGKEIEWEDEGTDLELDRKVLETIRDPLLHLLRNAVDHGIERPDRRARAGKPPAGRLSVGLRLLEGGRVEIRVRDDGRGMDATRLREAAVRARVLTAAEARALPDEAAVGLAFRSGLSTSPVISDISGHGLGLAIVRDHVERLGGRVTLETTAGAGTTVRMFLPVAVATFSGLLVAEGGAQYLLPADAVDSVLGVDPDGLGTLEGRPVLRLPEGPVAVTRLAAALGASAPRTPSREPGAAVPCVIVRSAQGRAGLLVDGVLGIHEGLVKELAPPLLRVRHVTAAVLLGAGEMVATLRPADLVASALGWPSARARATEPEQKRPRKLLVADDSITTRAMLASLLAGAGYEVQAAADGPSAWAALESGEFDLVISDVDMPGVDGFELTRRIRAHSRLGLVPVILVTALDSAEDRERGVEAGADAYLVKSRFEESNLLDLVRRLT